MAAPEEDAPAGAPDWIVTFTDLVSLLVAFFVLLMTFSSLENWDSFKVRGDLLGTRGTLDDTNGGTLVDPPQTDVMSAMDATRGAEHPHSRPPEELLENLDEMGQRKADDQVEIDLKAIRDGLVLHFDDRSTFRPGSVEPTPQLVKSLGEIGRVLEHYAYTVTIEGFTDNAFQPTPQYPTAKALGVARAVAAARAMTENSGLSPLMIQVAGLGDSRGITNNETPMDRARNRRVELRIHSLSRTRAAAVGLGG